MRAADQSEASEYSAGRQDPALFRWDRTNEVLASMTHIIKLAFVSSVFVPLVLNLLHSNQPRS